VSELPDGFLYHADFSGLPARAELQSTIEAALVTLLRNDRARGATDADLQRRPLLGGGVVPLTAEAVADIVDDGFNQCFEAYAPRRWNWGYLLPLYLGGVALRFIIIFPFRLAIIAIASLALAIHFAAIFLIFRSPESHPTRDNHARTALTFYAQSLMFSFGAVVTYHGVRPRIRAGQVFVANHSSLLDFVFLLGLQPFSVVGQLHGGLVGWFQQNVFACLECLWFERKSAKDRAAVRDQIQHHVSSASVAPLVIFPEGTCVANKHVVQFKLGAFELDNVDVIPTAILYNKEWASGFWDSRRESFIAYLYRLMTAWCVVVDIHFLQPLRRGPDESVVDFAERAKLAIANHIGLIPVSWDGYLKHMHPSPRYTKERQKEAATDLMRRFDHEEVRQRSERQQMVEHQLSAAPATTLRQRQMPAAAATVVS
jgi:glycerol-3-phosphate O-acyltransferase 3/4